MVEAKLKTPVTFIIFNRPDLTERTFAQIALAKPEKLLVIADGPRRSRLGESIKCEAARNVIKKVDWDCEVLTHYSDENMGCKNRISSGMDWAFQMVEETIVLEDDCLPHPTFFQYCSQLLEKYRDDERVGVIGGDNFLFGKLQIPTSYYFSMDPHLWGWASWRRVWKNYDVTMQTLPQTLQQDHLKHLLGKNVAEFWEKVFLRAHQNQLDTWDFQLVYALFMQNQYCIIPKVNLISNIGYGSDATHTSQGQTPLANMAAEAMTFPLIHPTSFIRHYEADRIVNQIVNGIQEVQPAAIPIENPHTLTFNRQKMRTSLPADVKKATLTVIQLLMQEADYNLTFGSKSTARQLYLQALDRTGGHPAFQELAGQLRSLVDQIG